MDTAGCTLYFSRRNALRSFIMHKGLSHDTFEGVACIFISYLDVLLMSNSGLVYSGNRELEISLCLGLIYLSRKIRTGLILMHRDVVIMNNYGKNTQFPIINMPGVFN